MNSTDSSSGTEKKSADPASTVRFTALPGFCNNPGCRNKCIYLESPDIRPFVPRIYISIVPDVLRRSIPCTLEIRTRIMINPPLTLLFLPRFFLRLPFSTPSCLSNAFLARYLNPVSTDNLLYWRLVYIPFLYKNLYFSPSRVIRGIKVWRGMRVWIWECEGVWGYEYESVKGYEGMNMRVWRDVLRGY